MYNSHKDEMGYVRVEKYKKNMLNAKQRQAAIDAGVAQKHIEGWNGSPYIPEGKDRIVIVVEKGKVVTKRFKQPKDLATYLSSRKNVHLSSVCVAFMLKYGYNKGISKQQMEHAVIREEQRKKKRKEKSHKK